MTSAAMDEVVVEPAPVGLHYGFPCAFAGCSGFVHPAAGMVGVVLCAPWGFEDLIMRKSWRLLAEAIAKAGTPCIRFDYPGTGDSLGLAVDVASVKEWVGAIGAAAETLRLHTGAIVGALPGLRTCESHGPVGSPGGLCARTSHLARVR